MNIRNVLYIILILSSIVPVGRLYAREALIISGDQFSTNSQLDVNNKVQNLADENLLTAYHSQQGENLTEMPYIEVRFNTPLELKENEDLIVGVLRCNEHTDRHPTTFKVAGLFENSSGVDEWEDFCNIYLLYRGKGTQEYSSRIRNKKPYKALRFTVTANNSRHFNSKGYREMGLAYLQIYKLDRNENYSDVFKDRLHLVNDYIDTYRDYGFRNTMGVIAADNRGAVSTNWCDWGHWDSDGIWRANNDILKKYGIDMPKYTMLVGGDNSEYPVDRGQSRQPSHVTEHVLYAIPGDVIALYPYYDFASSTAYEENFSHWYDYRTGSSLSVVTNEETGEQTNLLDFLIDPYMVVRTDQHGYFGGKELSIKEPIRDDFVKISTPQDYISFVKKSESNVNIKGELLADLDFSGIDNVPQLGKSYFYGTLDGNGHRIKNLHMNGKTNVGLVCNLGNSGVIKNLVIDKSCSFTGESNVGAVAGSNIFANQRQILNVSSFATVEATVENAGGLIGKDEYEYLPSTIITNCIVGGIVKAPKGAGAIIGGENRDPNKKNIKVTNSISLAEVSEPNLENSFCCASGVFTNCYDVNGSEGTTLITKEEVKTDDFISKLGEGWQLGEDGPLPPVERDKPVADRKYGAVATFFYPRDPGKEAMYSLPFRSGDNEEYVIAADFSQTFDKNRNIKGNEIVEPVVSFRHIFRIRDGKKFADEFSATVEANDEYIRKNKRHVSARAGKRFQVRLDSPIPVYSNNGMTPRSKYYYKISDNDYRRVCTMNIHVFDADTHEEVSTDKVKFEFGEKFIGQGKRVINAVDYYIAGGGGEYYRMLKCNNPPVGRFLVQITGNDVNGNPIKIPGTDTDLKIMELQVVFLPEKGASLVTEDELYENDLYKHAREEELEMACGLPKDKVDFDEYRFLEDSNILSEADQQNYFARDKNHRYWKWPMTWSGSNYSFGYDNLHDFNMYMIASHSSRLGRFQEAAKKWPADKNYEAGEGGLYDRLFYKTRRRGETPQRGYFYFVNAASDPGVMAKLSVKDLCLGSTVYVSAWIAEMSSVNETANLAFNFVAILKDRNNLDADGNPSAGERVLLHTYVSGYIPRPWDGDTDFSRGSSEDIERRGQWMNVYYSFVPDYAETGLVPEDIHHYELELDNNCKNSGGADYAIDNIRLYIAKPMIYASQFTPVCDKDTKSTKVKVEIPFDVLLQTLGKSEAPDASQSQEVGLYYTFIDKRKFDSKYEELVAAGDDEPGRKAYEEAVLRYKYNEYGTTDQTFGKLSFRTKFSLNPDYDADRFDDVALKEDGSDGERMIAFNAKPNDEDLSSGKEYYLSIFTPLSATGEDFSPGWSDFDVMNNCAKMCVFRVKPSSVIKIDGEVRNDIDDISCCENQSPVVQVNIYGMLDGELAEIEKNAYMDWFDGTNAEYQEMKRGDILLSDAMIIFRSIYPDADNADVDAVPDMGFTEDMRNYILEMSTQIPDGSKTPRLILYRSSYVFNPVTLAEGQEYKDLYVLALPIAVSEGSVLVCAQPTEVRMRVRNQAPELYHGLRDGIPYPESLRDVPLRIGLSQLKKASADVDTDLELHSDRLNIPVRKVASTSENVVSMRMGTEDGDHLIYLVETNDPQYKNLGTLDGSGEETGTLMAVGELVGLTANVTESSENIFNVVFYGDFRFKEGYYYRMRFMFEEDAPESGLDSAGEENESVVCNGQDVFTIKVVPEYQKWTGKASATNRNWNNDYNWERVTYEDLSVKSDSRKEELTEYVADGVGLFKNERTFSYAPLDFTRVIIPESEKFPQILNHDLTDLSIYYSGIVNPDGSKAVLWTKDPSSARDGSAPAGMATKDIQYDMAAYSIEASGIFCRPWYANTCAEIHFRPFSEIEGQRHLIYGKAWVDVENKAGRWYTLALPLKSVYAGDMYLPSDNGRQETELFKDMVFSKGEYNRFCPAVFQRSWDRSRAVVYEMKDGLSVNVAVKADWSHVYNDVTENYGLGKGFSIKTDVSAITGHDGGSVVFRLPKSDTGFDYYSHDGSVVGNHTDVLREDDKHFRLNDVEGTINVASRSGNRYFLVGNPFMSHLDMSKFLERNSSKINPKYWIITEGSQKMSVFDQASDGFVGSASGTVAPLQGFFVEAKDGATVESGDGEIVLSLEYDESMSCVMPFTGSLLRSATRSEADEASCVTITALRGDEVVSKAFINVSEVADKGYRESEDVVMFDNSDLGIPVSVYTIAGDKALSVNSTNVVKDTEIGVLATDTEESMLIFEGVDRLEGLSLYDSETGRYTDLYDGMEYRVSGSVSGRLFLTQRFALDDEEEGIRISVKGNEVRISTREGSGLTADVYNVPGSKVLSLSSMDNELSFALERGIYIIEVSDGSERVAKKVMIKK